MYKCKKKIIYPAPNFIKFNCSDKYKNLIQVDMCIADEVENLWIAGIRTTGCCCGHGKYLGFIQVVDEDIEKMIKLGYVNYVYEDDFGGSKGKDAFVPKSYGHTFDGYSNEFQG